MAARRTTRDRVIQQAIDHYERKGNIVGASQARVTRSSSP